MKIGYRIGSHADIQALKELAIKSWTVYQNELTKENWDKLLSNLSKLETFEALLAQSTCFLATTEKDNIIGMAFLVPSGHPTDIYPKDWSYIRYVSVDPEFAGQGIGRQLTINCIDLALKSGEQCIALHTSEIMNKARHIYESLGFKIVKELEKRLGIRYWLYQLELPQNKG